MFIMKIISMWYQSFGIIILIKFQSCDIQFHIFLKDQKTLNIDKFKKNQTFNKKLILSNRLAFFSTIIFQNLINTDHTI